MTAMLLLRFVIRFKLPTEVTFALLQKIFAFNQVLFKIFGTLSKDTYRDICNYFGISPIEEQISARQGKFTSR